VDSPRFPWKKDHQLKEFTAYQNAFERRRGIKIKCLRTDGGGEYANREAQEYLKEQGIRWERSLPRTPQQKGRAERLKRTIMEMARCLMIDAGLGHEYWQYAATMATFIRNQTPTTSNKGTMSPFEAMWGQKPNLHNLHLFGCSSQVHVPDTLRGKLDPKTKDCIFLGYAEGVKADVFEHVATGQRFVSRDAIVGSVRFNSEPIAGGPPAHQGKSASTEVNPARTKGNMHETGSRSPMTEGSSTSSQDYEDDPLTRYEVMPARRPRQPPIRFMHEWALTAQTEDVLEPLTVAEALGSEHWKNAMEKEYKSLVHNETWDLVPLSQDRTIVSGKWCYQAKIDAKGTVLRHKARYVARGFTQQPGIDFTETTSPVEALTSLRALLAIAAENDMEIKQLDVDSAFLYGDLDEEIYLEQPEGFRVDGTNGEKLVCRLRKAIYGLKQAGRIWWKLIDNELKKLGFFNCTEDVCVYTRCTEGQKFLLAIYVDDLVVASTSIEQINELK
jgi:hypothetical protein